MSSPDAKKYFTLPATVLACSALPLFAVQKERMHESIHDRYKEQTEIMDVQVGDLTIGEDKVALFMGLKTAGRLQHFSQDDVFITPAASAENPDPAPVSQGDPETGFQTAWGSMDFLARFNEHVEVFWEFFISSRPHESEMQGSQGYIVVHSLPDDRLKGFFDIFDVRAGQYYINYGDHIYRRTDNARTHANPLVGNYVVDPHSTDIGIEIYTKNEKANFLVGVGSGTESESFSDGRGTAVHGKVWVTPTDNARVSGSVFAVDHSDNPTSSSSGGTRANLYRSQRSGGPYGGILDDGIAPSQVFIGTGQDLFAAQGDLTLVAGNLEFYAHVGVAEDSDTNGSADGSPADEWMYYAAEGIANVSDDAYFAFRYSGAQADTIRGASSDGRVDRFQVGGGVWVTPYILAKLELVHQAYSEFETGQTVSGVDAWRDPEFMGVVAEVGFSF